MTAFLLAHLSDVHLPPLPTPSAAELLGKRALGYLNWKRNRHAIHQRSVLNAVVADIHASHPDHIALTGDLVNLALEAEFAPVRAWLATVGTPDHVSLVPGNHDAYVRATQNRFAEVFGDYMRSDDAAADAPIVFPYLRRRGPLALIGLSTAVPTAPFMATGWLGQPQIGALDHLLAYLSGERLFRVLLIHHPLRSKHHHKRLTDSDALQAVLKRHAVNLILQGHDHIHSTMWFDGPQGRIPAIGVPSASSLAHGHKPAAAYNLFTIEPDGDRWRCAQTIRGVDDGGSVRELQRIQIS